MVPQRTIDPVWSPDSRWIAYVKHLDNLLHAVFVYNVETGKINQVTDGYSDATSPAWDASGKYLYFFAGTNLGLSTGWLDMTAYDRPTTRGIYMVILKKGEPSPFLPPTGDETVAPAPRPANDSTPAGRGEERLATATQLAGNGANAHVASVQERRSWHRARPNDDARAGSPGKHACIPRPTEAAPRPHTLWWDAMVLTVYDEAYTKYMKHLEPAVLRLEEAAVGLTQGLGLFAAAASVALPLTLVRH
jgi:hypothetical protein